MKITQKPENAILIRVGVDQSFGQWNAPCNTNSGDFVYIPIPEDIPSDHKLVKRYDNNILNALSNFNSANQCEISLPTALQNQPMHLDPDYDHLSYGDTIRRGKKLLSLKENDWVVFYSGLRSIDGQAQLVYALTGLLVVDSITQVQDIPKNQYHQNAHTRTSAPVDSDIVVKGKKALSGRFNKYINIGEFRNGAYRVRRELLDAWGDLTVNDGWIQRSANPPLFKNPNKFSQWLINQSPTLIAKNF